MKSDNIRKATKDDNVVNLIMSAAKEIFSSMHQSFIGDRAREVCQFLFENRHNKLSFENCIVYERSTVIIGMAIVYNQKKESSLGENQKKLLSKKYNIDIKLKNEGVENSYYIDCIAVEKEHQREGVGRSLLEFITGKYNPCGLIVNTEKNSARLLYEKMGFKISGSINIFENNYYQMKTTKK